MSESTSPNSTSTRERMVAGAVRLFRRQGPAATGWRQLVDETGTPRGSISHHFPSGKEELMLAAVTAGGAEIRGVIESLVRTRGDCVEAVGAFIDAAAAVLEASGFIDGCPISTVVLEQSHSSEAVRRRCSDELRSWVDAITFGLRRDGHDDEAAERLATTVVAAVEGALILARVERSTQPLHHVATELTPLLRIAPR